MRALLRKELGSLAPTGLAVLLLFLADSLFTPLNHPLDQIAWINVQEEILPERWFGSGFFLFVVGLTLAYSLLPREHEERTIEYLHSLPISRWGIYSTKFLAAWLVLAGCLVVEQFSYWLLQAFNHNSLEGHQFSLETALKVLLLKAAVGTSGLALGMLLSFVRHYGLLLLAVGAFALWRGQLLQPELARLSPLRLAAMRYTGSTLLVPWGDLGLHLLLAALAVALGFWLWSRSGEDLTALYQAWADRPLGRVGLGCTTLLLIVTGFAAIDASVGKSPPDVRFETFQTSRLTTRHYSFTYPAERHETVQRLAGQAEPVYRRLTSWLPVSEKAPGIVVDLTQQRATVHGVASHEKILLDLGDGLGPEELRGVLCHETCHVLAARLGSRRLLDYADASGLFNEGLAQYLSFEIAPVHPKRRDSRRLAAAWWSRHQPRFEEVCNRDLLTREYDVALEYPLGEVWVWALVDCYGRRAPARLLRSIGRDRGPAGLELMPFWQDSLQAAGFDLERVVQRWQVRLDELETREKAFLAGLPRLSGGVVEEDGSTLLLAHADRPLPPGASVVARWRGHPDDEPSTWQNLEDESEDKNAFRFYPENADSGEFQLGVRFSEDTYPLYERWQRAR